jgi:hypothetical protein
MTEQLDAEVAALKKRVAILGEEIARLERRRADDASFSRRNVFRLGGAAAAGLAAAVVAPAIPAAAGEDGDVVLGEDNTPTVTSRTAIIADYPGNEVAGFFNDAMTGAAVRGRAGSDAGFFAGTVSEVDGIPVGVYGESYEGTGVIGQSHISYGVFGGTSSGTAVGGYSVNGVGVEATSVSSTAVNAWTQQSDNAAPAISVESGGTGPAVDARNQAWTTTPTVRARSRNGAQPAVQALGKETTTNTFTGLALDVKGKARFNRSGVVTIPAGSASAMTQQAVMGGLSGARVLATMQTNPSANVTVKAAVPILSGANAGKINVILTGNAPAPVTVAWFVFG